MLVFSMSLHSSSVSDLGFPKTGTCDMEGFWLMCLSLCTFMVLIMRSASDDSVGKRGKFYVDHGLLCHSAMVLGFFV